MANLSDNLFAMNNLVIISWSFNTLYLSLINLSIWGIKINSSFWLENQKPLYAYWLMTGLIKAHHQTADVSELVSRTAQLIVRPVFNQEIKFCKDAWCQLSSTSGHALWLQLSFRHQWSLLHGTRMGFGWQGKGHTAPYGRLSFFRCPNGFGAFPNKEI